MTVDLQGTALVIGAICAGIAAVVGPVVTAYLQLKAAKQAESNRIAGAAAGDARDAQITAVHALVNHKSDEQNAKIEALTTELARVNQPGASPTPTESEGGPVTMNKDVPTVT